MRWWTPYSNMVAGSDMPESPHEQPYGQRWTALTFVAMAQFMVVLDVTVVNVALPSIQTELGISDANRQWVVTAYALAFGSLVLFGGRLADLWGRRRMFITGLIGFAVTSAVGGISTDGIMLFGARALQGAFGALLAPAALSLLGMMFTVPKERAKAFGIYGAIASGGGAAGLVLGGVITQYLSWRWAFFICVPLAIVAVYGARWVIRDVVDRGGGSLDISGMILATSGLGCLLFGFNRAESDGWTADITIGLLVAAVLLLTSFLLVERQSSHPLLPLDVLANRSRGGRYLILFLTMIAMFGLFLFLTYYFQLVRGYSPVRTAAAFLPLVASLYIGSTQIGARLMTRTPPRVLMTLSLLVAAAGMLILTSLSKDSSYGTVVLPAEVLVGMGITTASMPAISQVTQGVHAGHAGVAAALVSTSQQTGGAIGLAILNTIATRSTSRLLDVRCAGAQSSARCVPDVAAILRGYSVATWWAVAGLVLAATIAFAFVKVDQVGAVIPDRRTAEI